MAIETTMPVEVRIDRITHSGGQTTAFASLTLDRSFAVHGVRIVEKDKKVSVRMPFRSYKSEEEQKYVDIFHPVTAEARATLTAAVTDAFYLALDEELSALEKKETNPNGGL